MAVKCVNCGYVMKTNQEIQSTAMKFMKDLVGILVKVIGGSVTAKVTAGMLNSDNYGNGVPCPKCKATQQFEDC